MRKTKLRLFFLGLLALCLALPGCEDDSSSSRSTGTRKTEMGTSDKGQPPTPAFKAIAPEFNGDSAFAYVAKQLDFGPRIPNTPEHAACADWMARKFESFGAKVEMQMANVTAWDGIVFGIRNVIASYNPGAQKRVLVSAHWDSRPYADKDPDNPTAPVPGANDGASGVGVILELARQLQNTPPTVGVDFMLWDAEDYGNYNNNESWCLGSQHWARNPHQIGYKAEYGINLDMVGAAHPKFVKDGFSLQMARPYVDRLWTIAHQLGYGIHFPVAELDISSIDDHYFIMKIAGIPMVEIIDRNEITGDFFPHWHKTTDDLSQIKPEILKMVGQVVLEVLLREK